MGYHAPQMLFTENLFRKLFILVNAFLGRHSHLPKHQSDQPSGARSSYELEDMMRMHLAESCVAACEGLVYLNHQGLED